MNMDIFEIKKKNEQNNAEIEEIRRHLWPGFSKEENEVILRKLIGENFRFREKNFWSELLE